MDYNAIIIIMGTITAVMIVFVLFMSIYYLLFWSISGRKEVLVPHSDKLSKFAVLIAARNESEVI